ncbi:putative defense protein 1 [Carcharodon carcharias]|uniref:putative defense protein 1 n=1 Tax=Carcharodon carcharias TaxID=13397 RepID=UPI001B7DC927|nr:putative defense protein 1 [Carcharodon carcharias]
MGKLFAVAALGLFALCWPAAWPLPTGAPLGSCENMVPRHQGITSQTGPSPHSIMTQNSGSNVRVYINGPNYKGILLEARYPNANTAVGTWATPPDNTKTIPCFSRIDSAITHSNIADKTNTTIYTWIPPSLENCTEKAVVFLATVAQRKEIYWLNLTSEKIYVRCSGSMTSLSGFAVLATLMVSGLAAF